MSRVSLLVMLNVFVRNMKMPLGLCCARYISLSPASHQMSTMLCCDFSSEAGIRLFRRNQLLIGVISLCSVHSLLFSLCFCKVKRLQYHGASDSIGLQSTLSTGEPKVCNCFADNTESSPSSKDFLHKLLDISSDWQIIKL